MPFNNSPLAFDDVRAALDRALASPKGIRIRCASPSAAQTLQHRIHGFRSRDRKESRKIYPPDHTMHGNSPYDKLVIRKGAKDTEDASSIFIEPINAERLEVEEIQ